MSNILNKQQVLQKTAFGELSVAEPTPVVQVSAQYGVTDEMMSIVSAGGTTSNGESLFKTNTGTNPLGLSSLNTRKQLAYKPGQGALARFTALFTQGVNNSLQAAGLINSEDSFAFGYFDIGGASGNAFGVIYSTGGKVEHQELTITTASSAAENATVTVNGVGYTVPLTNAGGDANITATEIANSLSSQVPNFLFSANTTSGVSIVSSIDLIPEVNAAYAFTSGTAVGAWVQQTAGVGPNIELIKQADWNRNKMLVDDGDEFILDPTKGNVYSISIQYLGFGDISFYIENPTTGEPVLVHQIEYANQNTTPSVSNPTFRIGWLARNLGNTSDLSVRGASASGFVEGKNIIDTLPRAVESVTTSIGATQENVITIRNRFHFGDKVNRADIVPLLLSMGTEGAKGAFFRLTANSTFATPLNFSYVDEQSSVAEVATDQTVVSGGRFIASFLVTQQGRIISSNDFKTRVFPDDELTLSAAVTAVPAAVMSGSAVWQEDQ